LDRGVHAAVLRSRRFTMTTWSRLAVIWLLGSGCDLDSSLPSPDDAPSDTPVDTKPTYLKASNTGTDDHFGWSVAVSSDATTVAVSAPEEDSSGNENTDSAPDSGAVYVFVQNGDSWEQQAYLKAERPDAGDQFGYAIAISADGNTLVVGAPKEDSGSLTDQSDNSAIDSGAVYVFTRSGTTWSQDAYIKPAVIDLGLDRKDQFGFSVAISGGGTRLIVGTPFEDGEAGDPTSNSTEQSGAAYVFERASGAWSQRAYVKPTISRAASAFGYSVSISSDGLTFAVGAIGEASNADGVNGDPNDTTAPGAGAVYVFRGTDHVQTDYIKASKSDSSDVFGTIVALSGNGTTLVAGAHAEDSSSKGIGLNELDELSPNSGAAYVFERNGMGDWEQSAFLKAHNTGAGDFFARHLAISGDGNSVAIGALFEDSNTTGVNPGDNDAGADNGAVYLFRRAGATWNQDAFLKSPNTDASDCFGLVVGLDASGSRLVSGAYFEDSAARVVDGDASDDSAADSGAAYLFDLPR